MRNLCACVVILLFAFSKQASAIAFGIDFASHYTVSDLGAVPGLPSFYGGLTLLAGNPNTLLIGGNANTAAGRLYTIGVTRDADNHITGFTGTATQFGDVGDYNDGGVVYGPGGVLFTAQWNVNNLGQTLPGSTDEDRVDALGPLGIGGSSISALNFVPAGFPGAGQMKVVSWPDGNWYTVNYSPDGAGTYNLNSATLELSIVGGPEGFVYMDSTNPGFAVDSLLVSDYSLDRVSAYEIDAHGNPVVSTRRDFLTDLTGAEGALIDPLTGDFLFSTFGGGDRVIIVQGFMQPPSPTVPEPGPLAIMGLGLALLVVTKRRRH